MRQTCTVTRYDDGSPTVLATDVPVAPNFVGPVSMPDYDALAAQAVRTLGDGTKIFIGPRDDPFFVDLAAIFDLLTIRKVPGNKGKGVDGLGGFNCLTIAIQVPKTRLTRDGKTPNADNGVIGIYDSAVRPAVRTLNGDGTLSTSGPEVQVSRLGMPLVNEVVIPLGQKDRFNATKPTGDGALPALRRRPRAGRAADRALRHRRPGGPAQRPGHGVPDRDPRPQQADQPEPGAVRDAAAQHDHAAGAASRAASASWPVTSPGSRTAAVRSTTWSTSPSASWPARRRSPRTSTSRPTTSSATGSTPTTARSCPTSRTWRRRTIRSPTTTTASSAAASSRAAVPGSTWIPTT